MLCFRRFFLAPMLFLIGCASAYDVYRVDPAHTTASRPYGDQVLFYALPQTVVTIDATLEETAVDPPKCTDPVDVAFLADLGLKLFKPGVKVTNVVLASRAEPDPANLYAIKLSRAWYQKLTSSFGLSEAGVLTDSTMTAENQAVDFAVSTLKTAATLAVKLAAAGGPPLTTPPRTTPQGMKCDDAIITIREIRQTRNRLIRGIPPPPTAADGAALTLMLEKLAAEEAGLLANFRGERTLTTGTVKCEIAPAPAQQNSPIDLLQIADDGVKSITPYGLCRVPSDLQSTTASPRKLSLVITTDTMRQLSAAAMRVQSVRPDPSGLAYRIPAMTTLEVFDDQTSKAIDSRPVAQFGFVAALPRSADVSTFQSTVKAVLYPSTGAMQKLDLTATPQGAGFVTGVGEAAGTVLDAKAAKKKAEEAAADELAQLERKRKIFEERAKIAILEGQQ